MRWAHLFRDLEAQLERARADELAAEVADRTRIEASRLGLLDRLLPAVGQTVRLQVWGLGNIAGRLDHVAAQAVVLMDGAGREVLVPLDAILTAEGVAAHSATPGQHGLVFERLRLATALRQLARDRAPVRIVLRDASSISGTIDRVGADFLEIALHAAGEPRRRGEVMGAQVVPFAAIGAILSF